MLTFSVVNLTNWHVKKKFPCKEMFMLTDFCAKKILFTYFEQTRKKLKLTQEKLAKKFNTTHSAISAYENGITLIPTIFLIEFSKISNKSIDWFCSDKINE